MFHGREIVNGSQMMEKRGIEVRRKWSPEVFGSWAWWLLSVNTVLGS